MNFVGKFLSIKVFIISLALGLMASCSTVTVSHRPAWVGQVPKSEGDEYYVGRSFDEKNKKIGSLVASQDAYHQIIRDNFGLQTKFTKEVKEGLKFIDFQKEIKESSSLITLLGLREESIHFEKNESGNYDTWVLFKISKKKVAREILRIKNIPRLWIAVKNGI